MVLLPQPLEHKYVLLLFISEDGLFLPLRVLHTHGIVHNFCIELATRDWPTSETKTICILTSSEQFLAVFCHLLLGCQAWGRGHISTQGLTAQPAIYLLHSRGGP